MTSLRGNLRAVARALHALLAALVVLLAIAWEGMTQTTAMATVLLRAEEPSDVGPRDATEHGVVLDRPGVGPGDFAGRPRSTVADDRSATSLVVVSAVRCPRDPGGPWAESPRAFEVAIWLSDRPRERSMVLLN